MNDDRIEEILKEVTNDRGWNGTQNYPPGNTRLWIFQRSGAQTGQASCQKKVKIAVEDDQHGQDRTPMEEGAESQSWF